MKLTVGCLADIAYEIEDFDQDTLLDLTEAFADAEVEVLALQVGEAIVHINKRNIVSLVIE